MKTETEKEEYMFQYYKIAGLTVKMDTFGSTERQAIPYRIEEEPDADITIRTEYGATESEQRIDDENRKEYITSGRLFYRQLVDYGGMLLHASAVALDGKAYLFTADCGMGKSTHVALWRQVYGDERVRIINDDKPALRLEDGVWYAYGTPWSGKSTLNQNIRCPVAGICFLEQGKENRIERYEKSDIVFQIMKQSYWAGETQAQLKLLESIDNLLQRVPLWHMYCNMEPQAARVSYEAMSREYVTRHEECK